MRPKVAERLCRLLERAAKATCCESVEEALEEFREKVRRAARLEWEEPDDDGDGDDGRVPAFTRQQSRLLREFSRALLPDECREPEDDGERGRLLASSRGDGGDGGGERCRRERRRD